MKKRLSKYECEVMPIFFKDCAKCRHLMRDGNCRGSGVWWPIKELWLCRLQCLFLIAELLPLSEGLYPQDIYSSGYTEAARTSFRIGSAAPFESALTVRGELQYRLDRTGISGKWLVKEVQNGVSLGELPYETRQALHYVSGWRRKLSSYKTWLRQRERRHLQLI